jgi:DNA-binding GntR family transcriptional regulator
MNTISTAHSSSLILDRYATSNALWQISAPFAQTQDSLVASVFETLWKQIVEGERQQGERLIAGEIARELGVSRTPVQQALYQLHQAGLVEATAGRGFHVVIFSTADIRDLYDLRIILEVAAVRLVAAQIDPNVLHAALATINTLRHTPETELGAHFLRSDVQFHHELIAGNSGNRRLAEAIANQRAQMSLFLVGGTRLPGGITAALDEHEEIIHALLERDVDRSAKAVEHHIQRVKEDVLRQFATLHPPRVRRFRAAVIT